MKKGFTLIELLVVIAIIGILSAIGLVSLNGAREKARDAQAKSDIGQMRTALTLYADDNGGEFPAQAGALAANCVNADVSETSTGSAATGIWASGDDIVGDYLSTELISPSARTYNYCANETGAAATALEYVLFYELETGSGDRFYMLFSDGDVVDYEDAETTEPSCGAVADAPCAVT